MDRDGTNPIHSAVTRRDMTVTWDAMNRMLSYTQPGTVYVPSASIAYEYDLNGNIRRMTSTYQPISNTGSFLTATTQDYWYKYDSMNRFVVTMGTFTGSPGSGTISRGTTGQTITYNLAGERATSTDAASGETDYTYDARGQVSTVKIGGTVRARYVYDAMGRVTDYKEYKTDGTTVSYEHQYTYNQKSQITQDTMKRYVQGFASEIVVDGQKAVISGPPLAIAVSAPDKLGEVRSLVREWRTRQDSNL